jgi:hypothetical protein
LPARRPDARRCERGGGLANPSEDGGLDEFVEFNPNRRVNPATSAANASLRAVTISF